MNYKNIGLTRLLTSESVYQLGPAEPGPSFPYSIYGVAFAQMQDAACFGVSSAGEIWIKASLFRGGSDPARIGDISNGFTGIQYGQSGGPYYYANVYIDGILVATLSDYTVIGFRADIVLHIKADAADGLLEYLLYSQGDLVQTYTYNGAINGGAAFAGVFVSGQLGQFWSDVVVSDTALTVDDHADYEETLNGDTVRELISAANVIIADTRREVCRGVTLYGDTRRIVAGMIISADTRRDIVRSVRLAADTSREKYLAITLTADTARRVSNRVQISGNTKRRIPRMVQTDFSGPPYPSDGITAINLNLQEGTITDTASYGTVIHTLPKDELRGYILDFPYSFIVESTSHAGLEMTAKCTYDAESLFYTPRSSESGGKVQSLGLVNSLAAEMGKQAIYLGDVFFHNGGIGGKQANYKTFIQNMFGWSTRVPRIQFNVFLRGDKLIVCQRGAELNTVDLDAMEAAGWIASMPTYNREVVRTIWSKDIEQIQGEGGGEEPLAQGHGPRIVGGDDEYNDEKVTYDELTTPSGEVDSRPSHVYRQNADGSYTMIDYTYQWTGSNYVLREEYERTFSADGDLISSNRTYYEIQQGGWRNAVTIAEDAEGNTIGVGSSTSRTRPGDMTTSAYADQLKLARGGKWTGVKNGISGGTSLIDTEFPVDDTMAAKAIAEIRFMNQKIKETVTIDIVPPVSYSVPAYQHIVDFTDKILYKGNLYYLLSNSVTFTPTAHRQTIRIQRWFDHLPNQY